MRATLLALLAGTILAGPAEAAVLKPFTTLSAATVRLSDLFDGVGPGTDRVLGPGPAPGGRIVVPAPQLAAIARQYGVDWQPASPADRAVLEWPGRPLAREAVLEALRTGLEAAGAGSGPDLDVQLAAWSPPLVPEGAAPKPVVEQLDFDAATARFSATLLIDLPGVSPVSLRVAGRAQETAELPVPVRRLVAGEPIRAGDLRVMRVRATASRSELVRRDGQAIGMTPRHALPAGEPVLLDELAPPALVQKGGPVTLLLEQPGLSITAQGEAMEAGAAGEHVRVRNPLSQAVLEAEVIGPGRVRVAPESLPLRRPRAGAQMAVR